MKSISSSVSASLIFTFIIMLSAVVFGQGSDLKSDLNRSFIKVEHIRIGQESLRQAKQELSFSIPINDRNVQIDLYPREIRSPRYQAVESDASDERLLEKGEITTFTGRIVGQNSSIVRFSIFDGKIEGYFDLEGIRHYIEPASKYSKFADIEDFVVYKAGSLTEYGEMYCEDKVIVKVENVRKTTQDIQMLAPSALRIVEIATEADLELVNIYGGAALANNEILSLLNMIEGIYESQLNLTFSVVYQHAWTTATPYSGATRSSYLDAFRNHWNANFPTSQTPRDIAYLFTGKANFSGQGQAFFASVCSNPLAAYGLSGYINSTEANQILMAHEIGHVVGANHAEANVGCGNTLMNVSLSDQTPKIFCPVSRNEIANHVAVNGNCLAEQITSSVRFDFDGDRRADVGVFRPSNGVWFINNSGGGFNIFQFGQNGDMPVSADYDGDGKSDGAVFRGGIWYRLKSATNTFDAISFGFSTDIPSPADFDGDGKADIVVFRPSNGTWYSLRSNDNSYSAIQFGSAGDVPVAADYDGDGKADVNVFRPSNGVWYRTNSSNGAFFAAQFGQNGDQAINGDFDGDGKSDLAVWRPTNGGWYSLNSSNGGFTAIGFGVATDIPVAADYDGDSRTDISIFRPSDGVWHRLSSGSSNSYSTIQFGNGSDIPVSAR